MKLIGFGGTLGVGKDTAYKMLSAYSLSEPSCKAIFRRIAFADPLKFAALNAFGGEHRNYWGDPKDKNEIIQPWGVSGRQILQFLGTEMFRDLAPKLVPKIKNNFWIARLEQEIIQSDPEVIHCITDVRFQNEADWVTRNGGILIRITRAGPIFITGIQGHRSEEGFLAKERYYEISNDGTPFELLTALLNVIREHFSLD